MLAGRAWTGHGGVPIAPHPSLPSANSSMNIPGGASTLHMLRDSHNSLDVCLLLSHTTLDLTTITALLLKLLPYASLMLCPSEAIPAA